MFQQCVENFLAKQSYSVDSLELVLQCIASLSFTIVVVDIYGFILHSFKTCFVCFLSV